MRRRSFVVSFRQLAVPLLASMLLLGSALGARQTPPTRSFNVDTTEKSKTSVNLTFSPDGKSILSWGTEGFFRWDIQTGTLLERQTLRISFCQGNGDKDWSAPDSDDGQYAAALCGGQLALWLKSTATRSMTYPATALPFRKYALSPDSAMLATTGMPFGTSQKFDIFAKAMPEETLVQLRSAKTGQVVATLDGHRKAVRALGFSPSGSLLATADLNEVRVWDMRDRAVRFAFPGSVFAFSPDRQNISVANDDGVTIFDLLVGVKRKSLDGAGLPLYIHRLLFSPDGQTLAIAGSDSVMDFRDRVTLWSMNTLKLAQTILVGVRNETPMAFSPDSRFFAMAMTRSDYNGGVIQLWAINGSPAPAPPLTAPPPGTRAPPSAPPPVAAPTTDLDAILKRGSDAFAAKRFDDAVKAYQGAIALQPANADFRFNLGISLTNLGQWIEADRAYTEAIRLQPSHAQAYYQRGQARYFEGPDRAATAPGARFDPAIFDLVKAQSLDPNVEVRALRAFAYLAVGETDSALTDARNYLAAPGWRATQSQYMALVGYLAARQARHEDDAKAMLADCSVKCDVTAWPYPIIRFLRGELTGVALMALATDADKMTEARAYRGLDALLSGKTQDAIPDLRWVSEQGNKRFYEWPLATARLRDVASASTPARPAPAPPAPATVTFGGIGAELQAANGNIRVNSIVPNSPASRAGLQEDDLVLKVDGKATTGLTLDQTVAMIRGPVGTPVTVTIQIPGSTGDRSVTLKRESITAAAPAPAPAPPDAPPTKPLTPAPAPAPVVAAPTAASAPIASTIGVMKFVQLGYVLDFARSQLLTAEAMRDAGKLSPSNYTGMIDSAIAAIDAITGPNLVPHKIQLRWIRADVLTGAKNAGTYLGNMNVVIENALYTLSDVSPDPTWFYVLGVQLATLEHHTLYSNDSVNLGLVDLDKELNGDLEALKETAGDPPGDAPAWILKPLQTLVGMAKRGSYTSVDRGQLRAASLRVSTASEFDLPAMPARPAPAPFFVPPAAVVSDAVRSLCAAIDSGDLSKTRKLVAENPGLIASKSCGALEPPLALALRRKDEDLFEFLLANGADVSAPTVKGETPLRVALNSAVAVSMLLDKGADRQARNEFGHTALEQAKAFVDINTNPVVRAHWLETIRLLEARPAKSGSGSAIPRPPAFGQWAFRNSRGESWIENLTLAGDVRRPFAPPGGIPPSWSRQGNEIQFATAGSVYFVGTVTEGRIEGRYTPSRGSKDTWVAVRVAGIGASFTTTSAGQVTVGGVPADSPAGRAGLKTGDVVLTIDGHSATGADAQATLRLIQGGIGTSVTLTIQRSGDSGEHTVVIVREAAKVPGR